MTRCVIYHDPVSVGVSACAARYAVSVVWQLDPETLRVLSVWYGRTVIRSSYKMCYEAAQRLVDGAPAHTLADDVPEWSGLDSNVRAQRSALSVCLSVCLKQMMEGCRICPRSGAECACWG